MCSRGHECLANSAPTISGVVEKTTARRNPSRCNIRSRRSSKLTPHNSINASGAFAIKTGSTLSIARKFNGGCAALLAAACRSHEPLFSRCACGLGFDIRSCNRARNNTDSALQLRSISALKGGTSSVWSRPNLWFAPKKVSQVGFQL